LGGVAKLWVLTGLRQYYHKTNRSFDLWPVPGTEVLDRSSCITTTYAENVAPGATNPSLAVLYVDKNKQRKSLGQNRQGFSHREADEKSLLDEAFRREMGERGRANGDR